MKKLVELVEIYENNEKCVVLEVTGSRNELICLGCFNGSEKMFRLTKGDVQSCTIFYDSGKTCEWQWGGSSWTVVSSQLDEAGRLIQECIEQDLDISVLCHSDEDLQIQKKSEIKNRTHTIKVLGYEENCIHKDGNYYRCHAKGIDNIIAHFEALGFSLIDTPTDTLAPNGCPVKTFRIKKEKK